MEFQHQQQRYARPPQPPPSMGADPNHRPPPPGIPPPNPYYSSPHHHQFQYHHPQQQQSHHSPSPPPPLPSQQWAPPPLSDQHPPAPYAAHVPYPAHPLQHTNPYPSPLPPRPPLPPLYNQEYGKTSWGHHQSWEYPAHNNEEDWAAKARAWAAAKAATDSQQQQPAFNPIGRPEEQTHYHDQYSLPQDHLQQQPIPASTYQQYPAPAGLPPRTPLEQMQESANFSSGRSYVSEGQFSYAARDGNLVGDSTALFHQPGSSSISPSVHQQEVPSSYSSIAGNAESVDKNEVFQGSSSLPIAPAPQQHMQPPLPAEPPYAFGSHSAEQAPDLSDQPLDFAPRFNDHVQPKYTNADSGGIVRGIDPVATMHSNYSWAPPAGPGAGYPPMAPAPPSGLQVDPVINVTSPVLGHSAPMFGRMPGPTFQPAVPSLGTPFGMGGGAALHPSAFPGEAYGAIGASERPKKASVPTWLREEIIKNKAVIASAAQEHPKENTESNEDEAIDKSYGRGDQADSKSNDSSRSTEEEDEDEDDVEAARTAAINQEIKRILTEVLLKVTDELFEEIATKVLSEDDLTVEVYRSTATSNNKTSSSSPLLVTPKASAKVLVATKTAETNSDDASGKSTSSAPGDVLGLASYASDDDEDGVMQSSGLRDAKDYTEEQITDRKLDTGLLVLEDDAAQKITQKHGEKPAAGETDPGGSGHADASDDRRALVDELGNDGAAKEPAHGNAQYSSKTGPGVTELKEVDKVENIKSRGISDKKGAIKMEGPIESSLTEKSVIEESPRQTTKIETQKSDRREKRKSTNKDFRREMDGNKDRVHRKEDENYEKHDEGRGKKEKLDDQNGLKNRLNDKADSTRDKAKDYDSKRRGSSPDVKKRSRKEAERDRRDSVREENGRKRERTKDEKRERSRQKHVSDDSRHKRRRSSSTSSRDRGIKDNQYSSDESSDDSKRKLHSKRHKSPSPVRSKKRQVSRSPPSKHSQRKHSPYSSLETSRGRRSRSRSPARRRR